MNVIRDVNKLVNRVILISNMITILTNKTNSILKEYLRMQAVQLSSFYIDL